MGLLAKLFSKDKRGGPDGTPATLSPEPIADGRLAGPGGCSLFSISKPVWSYGLEAVPGILPEKKGRIRRIVFTQLVVQVSPNSGSAFSTAEDDRQQLSYGLPLWLAEALFFSKTCTSAVYVTLDSLNGSIPAKPWSPEDLRLFAQSSQDSLNYIVTGTLTQVGDRQKISLDLWDVQKLCHRKAFAAEWTPETADRALISLYEYFHVFMEWNAYPEGEGLVYAAPRRPSDWIQILGASLAFFLADKGVLSREPLVLPASTLDLVADLAVTGESASLAWLTLQSRALRLGKLGASVPVQIRDTPLVKAAQASLG